MDTFEYVSRHKIRFPSAVGLLTAEQLWGLPLTSKTQDRPNLNDIAKAVSAELRDAQEESFVEVPSDNSKSLEVALDAVKRVIAVRLEDRDRKAAAADRAERRRKLVDALAQKETDEITAKSKADILKELESLDAA